MPNPTIRWNGNRDKLPKISIVTPSFNHADYLEATILSVLDQGYPHLEYVIMDGGSTDGSAEIIAKYDSYLTYWRSHPDGGQYESINEGFGHTTGEIMAWLNSDDMLHRNALWTVAKIFNKFSQTEWIMGTPTWFDANGCTVSVGQVPRWSRYRILYGNWKWIQQESVFWSRSLWERSGGRLETSYKLAADFDLWVRFYRNAQMYTTTALIGGFRSSSNFQRGRKNRTLYLQEAKQIISNENKNVLSRRDVLKNKLIGFLIKKIPQRFHPRLFQWLDDSFKFPPVIVYNIGSGDFQLQQKI